MMATTYQVSQLARWVETLTSRVGRENFVRRLEVPQPALTNDGRRLRGVEVAPGLYLTRHGQFYATSHDEPTVARRLDLERVVDQYGVRSIQHEFASKAYARRLPLPNNK